MTLQIDIASPSEPQQPEGASFDCRKEPPPPDTFEAVTCLACGGSSHEPFIEAEEDLTGKPGRFSFVRCHGCDLVYQSPRLRFDVIPRYYDDEYIAHRRKTDWGILQPLYDRAMSGHDRRKCALIRKYHPLTKGSRVLDVGCGAGTFLERLRTRDGCDTVGVDFKDLSDLPAFGDTPLHVGRFADAPLGDTPFDVISMWHFLEHDYTPRESLEVARQRLADDGTFLIEVPRLDSRTFRWYGDRWPGLQAPQHTMLFDSNTLPQMVRKAGFDLVAHLPYGAFPAWFYVFAGAAFRRLKGKGLDLGKAIYPYFLGQLLCSPVLLFEKRLNLAMQTVVCRKSR